VGTQSFIGSIILWRKDDLRVREDIDVGCTYLTHMIAKRGKVT
jgi:hypothetical protein